MAPRPLHHASHGPPPPPLRGGGGSSTVAGSLILPRNAGEGAARMRGGGGNAVGGGGSGRRFNLRELAPARPNLGHSEIIGQMDEIGAKAGREPADPVADSQEPRRSQRRHH
jgi:hypothetical protein